MKLVTIIGPTASGKTSRAVEIAKKLKGKSSVEILVRSIGIWISVRGKILKSMEIYLTIL